MENVPDLIDRAYCKLGGLERLLGGYTLENAVISLTLLKHPSLLYRDMVCDIAHTHNSEPCLGVAGGDFHGLDIHILAGDDLFL